MSGLLNFMTYVGSALTGVGFVRVAELYGWQLLIGGLSVLAEMDVVICLPAWRRFVRGLQLPEASD